jgi:hypothetical protein
MSSLSAYRGRMVGRGNRPIAQGAAVVWLVG